MPNSQVLQLQEWWGRDHTSSMCTSAIFPRDQETLDLIVVLVDAEDRGYVICCNDFRLSPELGTCSKLIKTLEMPFDRFDSRIPYDNARSRVADLDRIPLSQNLFQAQR